MGLGFGSGPARLLLAVAAGLALVPLHTLGQDTYRCSGNTTNQIKLVVFRTEDIWIQNATRIPQAMETLRLEKKCGEDLNVTVMARTSSVRQGDHVHGLLCTIKGDAANTTEIVVDSEPPWLVPSANATGNLTVRCEYEVHIADFIVDVPEDWAYLSIDPEMHPDSMYDFDKGNVNGRSANITRGPASVLVKRFRSGADWVDRMSFVEPGDNRTREGDVPDFGMIELGHGWGGEDKVEGSTLQFFGRYEGILPYGARATVNFKPDANDPGRLVPSIAARSAADGEAVAVPRGKEFGVRRFFKSMCKTESMTCPDGDITTCGAVAKARILASGATRVEFLDDTNHHKVGVFWGTYGYDDAQKPVDHMAETSAAWYCGGALRFKVNHWTTNKPAVSNWPHKHKFGDTWTDKMPIVGGSDVMLECEITGRSGYELWIHLVPIWPYWRILNNPTDNLGGVLVQCWSMSLRDQGIFKRDAPGPRRLAAPEPEEEGAVY